MIVIIDSESPLATLLNWFSRYSTFDRQTLSNRDVESKFIFKKLQHENIKPRRYNLYDLMVRFYDLF